MKDSIGWLCLYIGCGLLFGVYVGWVHGEHKALVYYAAYVVELSLGIDNMFVFVMLFSLFNIPEQYQPRVLIWGVLGALFMRLGLLYFGLQFIKYFQWSHYIFGIILLVGGWRFIKKKHTPQNQFYKNILKKIFPVAPVEDTNRFFIKYKGKWCVTPLFLCLFSIEIADLIFAIDSIPAILTFSQNIWIVYASNIFAILGLRSTYFIVAYYIKRLQYLHYGLAAILCFIGIKTLLQDIYSLSMQGTLIFILIALVLSSGLSLYLPKKQ